MSKPRTASNITHFAPLPPLLRQRTFSERRRTIRRHTPLAKLSKSQSTLTQLDFVSSSSSNRALDVSSDEDFEESRPPKRQKRRSDGTRKLSVRSSDQSNLTQFERGDLGSFLKSERSGCSRNRASIKVWEDPEPYAWKAEVKDLQQHYPQNASWLLDGAHDAENVGTVPEIPESSQMRVESSQSVDRGIKMSQTDNVGELQTPAKSRIKPEIPSSQTPPSTKTSTRSTVRREDVDRSPLRQRSTNILATSPIRPSAGSRNTSLRMLEATKFRERSAKRADRMLTASPSKHSIASRPGDWEQVETTQTHTVEVQPNVRPIQHTQISQGPPSPRPVPRRLRRTLTVQDSQIDDFGPLSVVRTQSLDGETVSLQRITTIQDSEADPDQDDLYTSLEAEMYPSTTLEGLTQFPYLESTYDPAHSALDRDAERFLWKQTQMEHHVRAMDDVQEHDESETDDDDLDVRIAAAASTRNNRPLEVTAQSSQGNAITPKKRASDATRKASRHESEAMMPITHSPEKACPPERLHAVQDLDVQVVLSSPHNPSQISTIVPTQWSQALQPPDAESSDLKRLKEHVAADVDTMPSSPPKLFSAALDVLSSSPLPLPPSSLGFEHEDSNTRKADQAGKYRSDNSLESIVDFSLPPPPPLSSARR